MISDFGRSIAALLVVLVFSSMAPVRLQSADWAVVVFNPPDGLTFEEVRGIVPASDGSVWLASWGNGLARLKGGDWRIFGEGDGLPSRFVSSICLAEDGGLWIATRDGLARVRSDGESLERLTPPEKASGAVSRIWTCVKVMKTGDIWFGDGNGALLGCRKSPDLRSNLEWWPVLQSEKRSDSVWDILEASDGKIWVARGTGGIAIREDGNWSSQSSDSIRSVSNTALERVKNLLEDRTGRIWATGAKHPMFFDGKTWNLVKIRDADVQFCAESDAGEIFLGGQETLYRYSGGKATPMRFPVESGLPLVRRLVFSSSRRCWIGTKEGLLQIRKLRWQRKSYSPRKRLEGHAFVCAPDCAPIGLNAANRLIRYQDDGSWKTVVQIPGIEPKRFPRVTLPVDGRVWVRNGSRLHEVSLSDARVLESISLPEEFPEDRERGMDILLTRRGELFAFGEPGVFLYSSVAESWSKYPLPEIDDAVWSLSVVDDQTLLAGLEHHAEFWREGKAVRTVMQDRDQPHMVMFSEFTTDRSTYLGLRGLGVLEEKDGKLRTITPRDGLLSGRQFSFLEASDGALWFGAEHLGVSSHGDGLWIHYSHSDGLPNKQLISLGEYPRGVYWAAFEDYGLFCYEPENGAPYVQIKDSLAEVPAYENQLISFRGYDEYDDTPRADLEYSYRLVSPSKTGLWSTYSKATTRETGQLSPGKYKLEIRVADRDRNRGATSASIDFVVLLPVWKRPEIVSIVGALCVLASFLAFRLLHSHRQLKAHRDSLDNLVKKRTLSLEAANIALASEKERLSVTLKSIGDGVIAIDAEGRIMLLNQAAETLIGYGELDVIMQRFESIFQIVDERTLTKYEAPIQMLLDGESVAAEGEVALLVSPASKDTVLAINAAPIRDAAGEPIGAVFAFRDMTNDRRIEKERTMFLKLESLGVLAGGIAHDFNNILTAILGNLSLAKSDLQDPPRLEESLDYAETAVIRAQKLTSRLLTFSKGGAPVRRRARIAETVRASAEFALQGSSVRLQLELPADLWHVDVDLHQLDQVVQNMVLNAEQATPSGGSVFVGASNIEADSPNRPSRLREERWIQLSIRDSGKGISKDLQLKIFDPYFTTKDEGTGLGLAICFSVVQQHGGLIEVDSELGRGTEFRIYWPASNRAEPIVDLPIDEISQRSVLVVEDERIVLVAVVQMVERMGFRALSAQNGEEALDLFHAARKSGQPVDIAILDLTLHDGPGGKEIASSLSALDPEIKTIVSSGYSSDPVLANYHDYGFDGMIAKPYRLDDLRRVFREIGVR